MGASKCAHGVSGDVPEHPPSAKTGANLAKKSGKKRSQRASKRMPAERFFEKTKRRAMSIFGFGSGSQLGAMLGSKNEAKRAINRVKKRDLCAFLEGLLKECGFGDDLGTIVGARGKAKTSKSVGGFARNQFSAFTR